MPEQRHTVLVVEDDPEMLALVCEHLESEGYTAVGMGRGAEAITRVRAEGFDVVLTDLRMPDVDGMEVLRAAREAQRDVPVILVTAFGSIETAIQAIRQGAYDYVTKPFALEEISLLVGKALEDRRLREENRRLREEVAGRYRLHNLLGASPGMQAIFALIRQAAPSDANVLITGESGTGKELVAKALHYNSPRAERPFVPVNCAAVPASLLESELFGHLKGAFTGAVAARRGLFREAEGGTLFLDEIGDMAPELQAKLLRVIEDRAVRPVGSDEASRVDLRLLAATNTDLPTKIQESQFREDLYYRLAVIPIHIPPLRERREDIPLLAEHFLRRAAASGKAIRSFTPEAMAALLRHPWPGNARELENVVERAVTLTVGEQITPEALLLETSPAPAPATLLAQSARRPTIEELTAEYVALVLREVGGDKAKAAEILGISKRTLYRWEKQLGAGDSLSPAGTA
ncbi:MAG: sigma-54-dependent Fis family transcriptional regulator [candidate division NC10 bacterium RIFCSPLOWO2_12_FULL_66_18]|nr:MAG: sigma-54-dependent Fis family transcriptional regulator [candidate division NC10 bacterium RIFCSPLOWO2_02_FULL_66_22]OGB95909.1 MAG: sigma-54-dependent Fis family transcriptional regulator [candidate division NC10 bacterium RIFCSPLOWO2_12_FULL_66_18]